jgi:hypothetical protein
MRNIQVLNVRTLMILVAGVIFSFAYSLHSQLPGPESSPYELGTFTALWPQKPRFLTAWVAAHLFTKHFINTVGFRILWSMAFWTASSFLLAPYTKRLQIAPAAAPLVYAGFILIMMVHYVAPNIYAPWYVFDMPSILFYLIVFLLLTTDSRRNIVLGLVLTLVFTLNRETVAIALFHAAGWWFAEYWGSVPVGPVTRRFPAAVLGYLKNEPKVPRAGRFAIFGIGATLICTVIMHWALNEILGGWPMKDTLREFMHIGKELRLVYNLKSIIFFGAGFLQQFLATGFGIVFFLPFIFKQLNLRVKAILLFSIPPALALLTLGNFFIELREFDEYSPLMACLLAIAFSSANKISMAESEPSTAAG